MACGFPTEPILFNFLDQYSGNLCTWCPQELQGFEVKHFIKGLIKNVNHDLEDDFLIQFKILLNLNICPICDTSHIQTVLILSPCPDQHDWSDCCHS